MSDDAGKYVCIAALLVAGGLGARTALVCRRARRLGLAASDEVVWAALAFVYLLFAQTRVARVLGWLKGIGGWLRLMAKELGVYGNRRGFQIAASIAVLVIVVVLLVVGVVSFWDYIKRYRLAIGFTALAIGYGMIRFISLHEVDAWMGAMPWIRVVVEVTAAAGASAVAVVRASQLGSLAAARATEPPGST